MADIFSGVGLVARACRNMGAAAREWDLRHGSDFDICDRRVQLELKRKMHSGIIYACMFAPPCSSFSQAMDGSCKVRSPEFPWGLPGLSEKHQCKVDVGNNCLRAVLQLIGACIKLDIPWILEQPLTSRMWLTPELINIASRSSVHVVRCDQCQYGAPWRKSTLFMCGGIAFEDLQGLTRKCRGSRGMCSKTGQPHKMLSGKTAQGINWTRIAQAYPRSLANALGKSLLSRRRLELFGA